MNPRMKVKLQACCIKCNKAILTVVLLVLITFMFAPLYCNTSTTFNFYEVVRFVIINTDGHCYNHSEVVCTLHCQILHHDYQLSQNKVTELF